MPDAISAGQSAVHCRNPVGCHHVHALAHLLQQHAHGEHAAHRIAVRPRVRTHKEPLAFAQHIENYGNRVCEYFVLQIRCDSHARGFYGRYNFL